METGFLFVCGFLSIIQTVYNQNVDIYVYGYVGETIKLICPLTPPAVSGRTTWSGPPSNQIYFYNAGKNPNASRGERLSVNINEESKSYDLVIKDFNSSVDEGLYSCEVNTNATPKHFIQLQLYVDVHNVSLTPSDNPLTIRESSQREVLCVVNSNAAPSPTITWYLGHTNITKMAGTNTTSINIIGERKDNNNILQCRAFNNNNQPPKTANATLNVEYPPDVSIMSQQNMVEGGDISVTCQATPGNPSSTTFYWTKMENSGFRLDGPTLQLYNIQRISSGTYRCTTENIYSNGEKGTDSQSLVVNVLFPPNVNMISSRNIIEGEDLSITCTATPGNPNSTTFYWIKVNNLVFRQDGHTLQLQNIQRTSSGTYRCTAENNYSDGKKGINSQSMDINVLYPPIVKTLSRQNIIEGWNLSVTCQATAGNPSFTTYYWTKVDNPGFRHNGPTLQLNSIKRTSSGIYRCTAENIFGNGKKGIHNQTMVVNALYPPVVNISSKQNMTEGGDLSVTCHVTPGNPTSTTVYWTKVDNLGFRQNGPTLLLSNIHRTSSGTYRCTAENDYNNEEKGTDSQSLDVIVLYPPIVKILSQQNIIEGRNLSITCRATPGNPSFTTYHWTKIDNLGFRQDGPTLQLYNIHRNSSGTYRCTAENNYSYREKGTGSQTMVVNTLYKPEIEENNPRTIVNESDQVTLIRQIVSNPLSNVSWYNGSKLLDTQFSVPTATFRIEKATCTDTNNFTLVASNSVQKNVTALVELVVNCKPRLYKRNFTLGVTDTSGINFSTIVIAYPEPLITLEYENGTESDQMKKSISRNAVNNFTIRISQEVVNQSDFGVYHLKVWNLFGEITVIVNVISQRKPNVPVNIEIVCEETRAKVQWKSSFNGGNPQLFTVIASSGQQSNNISDRGENVIHSAFVQHLQPSTMYVFYVSAQNSHGFISSEKISCTTLAESSEKLPIIVGSAAAGGFTLVVVVVVVVFLFRRFTNTENQAGKSQRFENDLVENESVDDDGLKDNILYVSADPRENEKHEASVYAAVNKKDPTSNNNSNVYAEVKKNGIKGVKEGAIYSDVKPKKGFIKKDGKIKKEKRQKRKREVADVYENSDDIAMTANPDNVYSNTNHNNDSTKEQRGYKNKDGLLYVEVQFDTKAEQRNPVIHGDDEKTDYATVEFPMPSSSHDRE